MSRITSVFYGTKMLSVLKMKKKTNRDRTLEKDGRGLLFSFRFFDLCCDACCLSSIRAIMQLIASD